MVSVLAAGAFLVLSVQVFRKESPAGGQQRASGTGGFALIGELSTPVYEDLNAVAVRDSLGLPAEEGGRDLPHARSLRQDQQAIPQDRPACPAADRAGEAKRIRRPQNPKTPLF